MVTSAHLVYPRPPNQPQPVARNATVEVPFTQVAGPAVVGMIYPQMMFLRIASRGGGFEPTFLLIAGNGDPVELTTKEAAIHRAPGGIGYVGDGWLKESEPNGVYALYFGFDTITTEQWRLGIRNNDMFSEYRFTWVVANNPAATRQPWIDISPQSLSFERLVGQTQVGSVTVANFGTVGFSLTGFMPALPGPLVINTSLPVSVAPAASSTVQVTFKAPTPPPLPNGELNGSSVAVLTPADQATTNTPGHNGSLVYRTKTRWPAPAFAAPGGQFTPKAGPEGTPVTLMGSGFDVPGLAVTFGDNPADVAGAASATSVQVKVPTGLMRASAIREVPISVRTDGGTATSVDTFGVVPPPRFAAGDQFSPGIGPPGTPVTLKGTGFDMPNLVVRFGTKEADPPSSVTTESISVTVPSGVLPAGTTSRQVPITVSTFGGTITSTKMFTVVAAPRFVAANEQFRPHRGPPGTLITLAGTGFDGPGLTVRFKRSGNGGPLPPVDATPVDPPTPNAVRVAVPSTFGLGTFARVIVSTAGGSHTSDDLFRVQDHFNRGIVVKTPTNQPVVGISALRATSDGAMLSNATDAAGRWSFNETNFDKVKLMIGGPGFTALAATYEVDDWVDDKAITIEAEPNGGGLILDSVGFIPGLTGRLNLIRDQFARTYMYADNISIDDESFEPHQFVLGKSLDLQDATGTKFRVEVRENVAQTFLLGYTKTGQVASTISRSLRVIDSMGAPVRRLPVARIAANGTYFKGETNDAGIWSFSDWYTGALRFVAGGPGVLAASATFAAGQWVGEKTGRVSPVPNGGSLVIHGTGFIPGLEGRLNPIVDGFGRTYIYADDILINGSVQRPFQFQLGVAFTAADAAGHTFSITVTEILGRTTLLQYVKV